jgi:hypothetical protein
MIEFFADFLDAVQTVPVTRYALLAGLVSSLTFGVVGSLVVVRQISYIASAIAHSILGGIGAAVYFGRVHDLPWLTPMVGSIVAGAISVALIGWVTLRFKEREDTIISAIWATGMAAGLLFLHYAPGKAMNLESFIFGNILLTSKDDEVDEVMGLRLGADDYITKPFSQRLLVERIRALLRRQAANRAADSGEAPSATAEPPSGISSWACSGLKSSSTARSSSSG